MEDEVGWMSSRTASLGPSPGKLSWEVSAMDPDCG